MTTEELIAAFRANDDEYLKFERVSKRRNRRPDLHAFLLLDELFPADEDMIAGAAHDEIFLAVSAEQLAEIASPELIMELRRCGVRYDGSTDSLAMFA